MKHLVCPKCGHEWYSKAKGRAKCSQCNKMIPKKIVLDQPATNCSTKQQNVATVATSDDDLMRGNIFDALAKKNIDNGGV